MGQSAKALVFINRAGNFHFKTSKKVKLLQLSVGRGHSTLLGGHLNFISEFDKVI